jgi:uncharacterized membrane protein
MYVGPETREKMEFLKQLLLLPSLTGPIFIVVGMIMKRFPPRKINPLYGYRTGSSMKSQDRWDFAQTYSSNEMIKSGCLLLLTSLLGLAVDLNEVSEIALGLGLMILMIVLLIVRTEKAIQRKFGKV